MFESQYLFGTNSVYSPWMSRSGDNVIVTVDVVENDSSGIVIELFEKNSEDTGPGLAHPDGSFTTTSLRGDMTYKKVKELVRYKFTAQGTLSNRVLFRMLSPVWFDDVTA